LVFADLLLSVDLSGGVNMKERKHVRNSHYKSFSPRLTWRDPGEASWQWFESDHVNHIAWE
jgi:hypothetical protein